MVTLTVTHVSAAPVITIASEENPTLTVSMPSRASIALSGRGPQGAQGPAGPASAFYLHTQASPSTLWTVPHNLGFRPAVTVTTVGGLEVVADVLHLSDDTLTVSFTNAIAGYARLT